MKAAIERYLHGESVSRLLRKFDIDPKRYWLLMDLFHKLSTREEMTGQLGRQTHTLRVSAAWFFLFSGLAAVLSIVFQAHAFVLVGLTLGITVFSLMAVLLSEAANSLVNPEEALSLSHQPINGATYTAAKLSHLLRIVLYYVVGWNLLPALVTPLLTNGRWFYPPLHFIAAIILGILIALFCCSVYGLVMRVVPARRMKSASHFVQAIPIALFGILRFAPTGTLRRITGAVSSVVLPVIQTYPRSLALGSAAIAVAVTVIGLRSLSSDYLIRASSMVHGQSSTKTHNRRSILGEVVQRFFGGQAGRAGFDYMRRMMVRDWQLRRRLLGFLPLPAVLLLGMFGRTVESPFSSGFSAIHFVPHALGYALYTLCLMLPYGTDFKGIWLFLLVSDRSLSRFAKGVHASLWLMLIVIPIAVLLPILTWKWGISDAFLFSLFAIAVSSIYLACGLRMIDGVPFGKQVGPPTQNNAGGMIALMIASVLAVGIQFLLFRSAIAVIFATIVLAPAALFLTRWSLKSFETSIRHHLGTSSETSTMIYTEVNSA
jgi:hypothetical protein